ncbi:unnamed protein product [Nezara viridula]|uniref:Aldehyde dehydrogenase domain-containing protein n=1 Tax=Nezara viridula TaxID=85310 RepID=A0A9P0HTJ8_NEZVI|nr:unnamed protein product [Nezara viridula]
MANFHHVVSKARETFESGKTRSYEYRKKQLENFKRMVQENGDKIAQSLEQDLKKCKMESFFTEIGLLVTEIDYILENLKQWMAPDKPEKNLITMLDKVRIYNDPKGVVLVMGAWNYPINLTLMPVIGAISAGNCVIIKPSEVAPASANVIAELIPKYLDPCEVGIPVGKGTFVMLDWPWRLGSKDVGMGINKSQFGWKHCSAIFPYKIPLTLK